MSASSSAGRGTGQSVRTCTPALGESTMAVIVAPPLLWPVPVRLERFAFMCSDMASPRTHDMRTRGARRVLASFTRMPLPKRESARARG